MSVHARPVPPAPRHDAWGVSGKSIGGDISFKANPVVQFNVGARQRPQSAIATVNRKPFSQSLNSGNDGRITWEPESNKRASSQQEDSLSRHQMQRMSQNQGSNVPPLQKSILVHATDSPAPSSIRPEQNTPETNIPTIGFEGRQEFTGSSGQTASGARKRPISAMANMSRGTPSTQEKTEIEELKQEIMEITRTAAKTTKEKRGGGVSVKETEQILRRFVCTSDASQVHITKSALLALVLQRQDEYLRAVLAEFAGDGGGGDGKASQNRWGVMVGLADTARELQERVKEGMKDVEMSKAALNSARDQTKKVTEERDLLRAALSQASRDKSLGVRRPMSAPRSRTKPLQAAEKQDKEEAACVECEQREGREELLRGEVRSKEEKIKELQARVSELEKEREEWLRERDQLTQSLHLAATASQSPSRGISTADLEKVQRKLLDAEEAAARAAEHAAHDSAKLQARVKALEDKVQELEKKLAEEHARASSLEKRLSDATLTLKANGESSGGAVARERELLKQIELRTKEMTEARKEAERLESELARIKALGETVKQQREEERAEAEGIEKRLIVQLRELQGKIAALNKEVLAKTTQVSDLEGKCQRLQNQLRSLQSEIEKLKGQLEAPQAGEEEKRLREAITALEKKLKIVAGQLEQLRADKGRSDEEALELRRRLEDRERVAQAEREEAALAHNEELTNLKRALASTSDLRQQAELARGEAAKATERARLLQRELEWEKGRGEAAAGAEVTLRALRSDLERARDALAKGEGELRDRKGHCTALEKKLQAVMGRLEEADLRLIQMEGGREETRAVENGFKVKMKALYDKRVAELEVMQQELEAQRQGLPPSSSSSALLPRPSTAAAQPPPPPALGSARSSLHAASDGMRQAGRPATASVGGSMSGRRR